MRERERRGREMQISKGEENEEEPRTVVVGVKMDAESRELLTWALVKVARAGDRVVALHVIPWSSELSDPNGRRSSLLSLVKAFDSVRAVYEGFCNLKQIDLKLQICRGSSIRKVLVRETKSYDASNLILGINKNCRGITYSSTSIAKYCSKKLTKYCSVLAVKNGKIVFQREAAEKRNSFETHGGKHVYYDNLLAINGHQLTKNFNASRPSLSCLTVASKSRWTCGNTNLDDLKDRDCSVSSPTSSSSGSSQLGEGRDQNCAKSRKDDSLALAPLKKTESLPTSIRSLIVRELHEVKPGWPLLRMAILADKKINSHDKPKVSVVQWAMRLPSRFAATSIVRSDCKHNNSDEEDWTIVPVERSDSSCSSLAIYDKEKELPEELRSLQEKYSSVCSLFSYKELKHATSNFSLENLIGRGGNSQVYKGCLSDGKELAVKLLKPSEDILKEFVSEIEIITTLHHKNIISLYGFCVENDNLIFVYDFLSRGSLEEILHGKKENKDTLSWGERYKIAVGVAEALDYLHGGGSAQPVIHRDVKSSNILLSDDFDPQLADFGLALWASSSSSHMTFNDVAGTFGYLAPEYLVHGKVNEKIDVYAFGVVLLELLSGRKPISSQCPKGEESLVMWAKKNLQDGKVKQLVDPCLGDKYDNDQLERMILAASFCIRQSPRSRPRIALVMKLLQGDSDVLRWARSQGNATEKFDGLDDEAANPNSIIQSHTDAADDSVSVSSIDHLVHFLTSNTSLEDYMKGRYSRSSSFD